MEASELLANGIWNFLYYYILIPFICIVCVSMFFRFYTWVTLGMCYCGTSMVGKTVIITGANRGIGKETALELAKRGAKIIMACRDLKSAECAAEEIIKNSGNDDVIVRQLDLGSFKSVRNFAKVILETEEKVHMLINNAGVLGLPKRTTAIDGCELTMQTNHFSHFLLTNLLLDLLKKSAPSRIINVSSILYLLASMDLDDLQHVNMCYNGWWVYANSKMANIHFTKELSRRLEGTGVTANCLHPGAVKTRMASQLDGSLLKLFLSLLTYGMTKNPTQGAQTTIHLALAPELEKVSGKYFADCKKQRLHRRATLTEHNAKKLWTISEKIVGLNE